MPRRGVLPPAIASFILSLVACVLALIALVGGGAAASPDTTTAYCYAARG